MSGIATSSLSRYRRGGSPKAEHIFPLADALKCSARWLISGAVDRTHLELAEDTDWVSIPEHDVRQFGETGKGEPLAATPFRRDWLNKVFGKTGVWLAHLPSGYPALDLEEGDRVVCTDIKHGELRERYLCIWRERGSERLIVARFSTVRKESVYIDDAGEYWIGRIALGYRDSQGEDIPPEFDPVARILGRPLAPIR